VGFVFHRVRVVHNCPLQAGDPCVRRKQYRTIFASTLLRRCPVNAVHSSSPSSSRSSCFKLARSSILTSKYITAARIGPCLPSFGPRFMCVP
jgi:hypothetical protein